MCVSFRAVKNSVVAKLLKHDTRLQRKLTQKNVYDLFMMYSSIHAVCQHQRVCNKSQNKNSFFKNKKRKKVILNCKAIDIQYVLVFELNVFFSAHAALFGFCVVFFFLFA